MKRCQWCGMKEQHKASMPACPNGEAHRFVRVPEKSIDYGSVNDEKRMHGYRGVRWVENVSCGLRRVGFADEIMRGEGYPRAIDHKGWFIHDEDYGEVYRGVVYQLPARHGLPQYVIGYDDPYNDDCALLSFYALRFPRDDDSSRDHGVAHHAGRDRETPGEAGASRRGGVPRVAPRIGGVERLHLLLLHAGPRSACAGHDRDGVVMATMVMDDKPEWYRAYLETPLTFPRGLSEAEVFKQPGSSVKSIEKAGPNDPVPGMPKFFGKLVKYTDSLGEECIVRGHGDGMPGSIFVWRGTVSEYHATWRCD